MYIVCVYYRLYSYINEYIVTSEGRCPHLRCIIGCRLCVDYYILLIINCIFLCKNFVRITLRAFEIVTSAIEKQYILLDLNICDECGRLSFSDISKDHFIAFLNQLICLLKVEPFSVALGKVDTRRLISNLNIKN